MPRQIDQFSNKMLCLGIEILCTPTTFFSFMEENVTLPPPPDNQSVGPPGVLACLPQTDPSHGDFRKHWCEEAALAKNI
jgi:hypothetical protein